jgi:hypothetical protein
MESKDQDIWLHLASEFNFQVLDLLSDAERGTLSGKKVICRKPFSDDSKINEAIIKYLESKNVLLVKSYT